MGRNAQEALAKLRATQAQAGAAVVTNSHLTASMDEEMARRGEAEELAEELQQKLSAAGETIAQQEDMLNKVCVRVCVVCVNETHVYVFERMCVRVFV